MPNFIDLTGKRFGRWTVIAKSDFEGNGRKPKIHWVCMCECGNTSIVAGNTLRNGTSISCGCVQREWVQQNKNRLTHGGCKDRLYRVWIGMRQRCNLSTHNRYKNYGGRGIRVCSDWEDYESFRRWALNNGYDPQATRGKTTIDRIDPDGNYCPQNCRWVDSKVQANNKSRKGEK